ncbi:MAG: hypothetical protein ACT4UP_03685 [Gammaproteobacteria bacterium]
MSLIAALRQHQRRTARLAAALFAFGWLGFAIAPCQAMVAMPDDAPHHDSMPMDDCGHCPPADTLPDCAEAAPADCASATEPAIELRNSEQAKPVAIAVSFAIVPLPVAAGVRPVPCTGPPPPPHASIQQRFCSYLK